MRVPHLYCTGTSFLYINEVLSTLSLRLSEFCTMTCPVHSFLCLFYTQETIHRTHQSTKSVKTRKRTAEATNFTGVYSTTSRQTARSRVFPTLHKIPPSRTLSIRRPSELSVTATDTQVTTTESLHIIFHSTGSCLRVYLVPMHN